MHALGKRALGSSREIVRYLCIGPSNQPGVALTRVISRACIMWAYFNSWDVVGDNDTAMMTLPCNIVVPTTRLLHSAEEKMIVEYFHISGRKRLPPGLPYAADGLIVALNARATKEIEIMPYSMELVAIVCMDVLNDDVHSRYMYVKRMRLTGLKQLREICRCAYHKVNEFSDTEGNHTEQDSFTEAMELSPKLWSSASGAAEALELSWWHKHILREMT